MYNAHRGMVPPPGSRLSELLDQLRQEFENQSRSTGEFEHQCVYTPFSFCSSPFPFPLSPPSFALVLASCIETIIHAAAFRPFVLDAYVCCAECRAMQILDKSHLIN